MSTTVDTEPVPRPRHRARWLAGVAVLVAVAVAVLLRGLLAGGGGPQDGLSAQLADRVVAILEQASTAEHAEHGHHFGDACEPNSVLCGDEGGILCAAEPFGYEPSDATSLAQVRVVYTHHMCAVVAGIPWPQAVRAAGPIAVELGDPPRVILPGEGSSYADEIRAIIPERYHEVALSTEGFSQSAAIEELRRRLGDANG